MKDQQNPNWEIETKKERRVFENPLIHDLDDHKDLLISHHDRIGRLEETVQNLEIQLACFIRYFSLQLKNGPEEAHLIPGVLREIFSDFSKFQSLPNWPDKLTEWYLGEKLTFEEDSEPVTEFGGDYGK